MRVELVEYDRRYLDLSWYWLQDAEVKRLTLTPDFTRVDQERFFASLSGRADYRIWGVALEGRPIGAAGIKSIVSRIGEYWGYIGEKSLWGTGLGPSLLAASELKAEELGLETLCLRVHDTNTRAIGAYTRAGFREDDATNGVLTMRKSLHAAGVARSSE